MIVPMMGRMLIPDMTRPLRWKRVANQPVPTIEVTWMTPNGMLNKMVWKLLNPKDLTISDPKVPMPPLEILSSTY
jgi:hypothetical protein